MAALFLSMFMDLFVRILHFKKTTWFYKYDKYTPFILSLISLPENICWESYPKQSWKIAKTISIKLWSLYFIIYRNDDQL